MCLTASTRTEFCLPEALLKKRLSKQSQNKYVQTRLSKKFQYNKCLWCRALEITSRSFSIKRLATVGNNDDRIKDAAKVSFMVFSDSDTQSPVCSNFCFQATCASDFPCVPSPPTWACWAASASAAITSRERESEREWRELAPLPPTPPPPAPRPTAPDVQAHPAATCQGLHYGDWLKD